MAPRDRRRFVRRLRVIRSDRDGGRAAQAAAGTAGQAGDKRRPGARGIEQPSRARGADENCDLPVGERQPGLREPSGERQRGTG